MKKPHKDRGTKTTQVAPSVVLLVLLIANGQGLMVMLQPTCG